MSEKDKLIALLDMADGYIDTLADMVRRPWEDTETAAGVADELQAKFSRDLLSLVTAESDETAETLTK